jgi:hypothetical protein
LRYDSDPRSYPQARLAKAASAATRPPPLRAGFGIDGNFKEAEGGL